MASWGSNVMVTPLNLCCTALLLFKNAVMMLIRKGFSGLQHFQNALKFAECSGLSILHGLRTESLESRKLIDKDVYTHEEQMQAAC